MLNFSSDYIKTCHPEILKTLQDSLATTHTGYGTDDICAEAKKRIAEQTGTDPEDIFFVSGGTQTNQLAIDTMLKEYEGVISADTGHVNTHEAGAIEYTGHKVMHVPGHNGLIDAGELKDFAETFYQDGNHEHMVFPGMVYISFPTEYGTLYTKKQLADIAAVCREYHMIFDLDGARLGYGLAADTDVTLRDIAELTDAFYIGGTKVGAMMGEALVFTKHNTPSHFVHRLKKHGALMAKGWIMGAQFETLFRDGLYGRISANAIEKARDLRRGLEKRGFRFWLDSPTNQQFVVLENGFADRLQKEVVLSYWEKADEEHTVYRFATNWATTGEDLDELWKVMDRISAL